MSSHNDQSSFWNALGDRRLFVLKFFVILTAVFAVGVLLFCLWRRDSLSAAPPSSPPASTAAVKTPPSREPELLVNQSLYEDRYVVEAVVPGVDPEVRVGCDPLTRRSMLTISWSPQARPDLDGKQRYSRREWQPSAFSRTLPLPDGVSTPDAVLKDGILTLSFPRSPSVEKTILPRKEH